MSALAALPDLSALLAWPTEHSTDAADHWEAVAGRSYGVANQVWRDSISVDWHGGAADRLRSATHADMLTTSAVADQLQHAAKVARSGASDLYAARSRFRYAVDDARAAGFSVSDDLSITERRTAGSPAELAARRTQAEVLADDIRHRATQLVDIDQQLAGRITAAVAGIRHTFPRAPASDGPPNDHHVRAVDNHSLKNDPSLPTPAPRGSPFAGWTDQQMAQVATEIAQAPPAARPVPSPPVTGGGGSIGIGGGGGIPGPGIGGLHVPTEEMD